MWQKLVKQTDIISTSLFVFLPLLCTALSSQPDIYLLYLYWLIRTRGMLVTVIISGNVSVTASCYQRLILIQVLRMLPGGLDIVGVFALAPPAMMQVAQAKLRQVREQ